jgi:hypothetical protein
MGLAAYDIVGSAGEWRVRHDGKAENVYETKEAAFEAAVAAASLALRQGHVSLDSGSTEALVRGGGDAAGIASSAPATES